MKTIRLVCIILCTVASINIQAQLPTRDLSVQVINKRGKPVQQIVVQTLNTGNVGITDKNGQYTFINIDNNEIIRIFLPGQTPVDLPVHGLDSLQVVYTKKQVHFYNMKGEEQIDIGYGSVSKRSNTIPANQLDIEEIVRQTNPKDLFDLMAGRIAGVEIGPGRTVKIRGTGTINSSTEPLVVIDGTPAGTLAEADSMLNIHDIKSISVLKEGAIYGSRGANGVILITTKGGSR